MASRKLLPPSTALYQDGRGSDPMIDVGSMTPADALNIASPSVCGDEPIMDTGTRRRQGPERPALMAFCYRSRFSLPLRNNRPPQALAQPEWRGGVGHESAISGGRAGLHQAGEA